MQDVEDYSSNYVERDEKRLADLGRRAIEIYAVSHILRELESVHSMEESIKRQDALIKEVSPIDAGTQSSGPNLRPQICCIIHTRLLCCTAQALTSWCKLVGQAWTLL